MNTNGAFLLSLSKAKPFLKVVCTYLASSHRGQKFTKNCNFSVVLGTSDT